MATGKREAAQLPPAAQPVVARIDLFGMDWTYFQDYPLPAPNKGTQVRDDAEKAPSREVTRYAEVMKQARYPEETLLPPIVVTYDGHVVDGNTRVEAARKRHWSTFPAVRLDVRWSDATKVESLAHDLYMLGMALNNTHGRGLSRKNLERMIKQVAHKDDSAYDLARKLQIPKGTVVSVMAGQRAVERAEMLNVDMGTMTRLSPTHLTRLGQSGVKLNDEPYKQLMLLVNEVAMSVSEQEDLIRRMVTLGSDEEKLDLLATEKTSRRQISHGNARKPPRSAILRQHLGYLLRYASTPGELVEISSSAMSGHYDILGQSIEVLQEIRDHQQLLLKPLGDAEDSDGI